MIILTDCIHCYNSRRIVSSLDSFADHVIIPLESSNFSVSRPNVAVNVYDLPLNDDTGWIYGIGIHQFTEHGVDGLDTFTTQADPSDVSTNHVAAILLSRDAMKSEQAFSGKDVSS